MSRSFIVGKYHVESHGNGWAYTITDRSTGQDLWFQDQDASIIEEQTCNFENMDILEDYFFDLD